MDYILAVCAALVYIVLAYIRNKDNLCEFDIIDTGITGLIFLFIISIINILF